MKQKHSGESDFRKGIKFLLLFTVLFSISYVILTFTPLEKVLGHIAAVSSQFLLGTFGTPTEITILQNGNYALESTTFVAELNQACAAIIEIAVLVGIVFASFEKSLKQRFNGFALGMVLLLVLNPIRIALSIIFLHPIVHDVLFRITLIITIIGFYAAWYYGALALDRKFWLEMHKKVRLK